MAHIDHLVYFVPDLAVGIDQAATTYGTQPVIGGQHPGRGTHNALLGLGDSYLELIAPDPEQPDPPHPRPFGIDARTEPGFLTFAVRPDGDDTIESLAAAIAAAGVGPGPVTAMSRRTPAGDELHWRLTFPPDPHDGAVPFLIDWGSTPPPHTTAPAGPHLAGITIHSPTATEVDAVIRALRLSDAVAVVPAPTTMITPHFHGD